MKRFLCVTALFMMTSVLAACGGGSTQIHAPQNYCEIEFLSDNFSDEEVISAQVSIGLGQTNNENYYYKLLVYNALDYNKQENWIVLKELGEYSDIYAYSQDKESIQYNYSEQLEIPKNIFHGESGKLVFILKGAILTDGQESGSVSQKNEFVYSHGSELNIITIVKAM